MEVVCSSVQGGVVTSGGGFSVSNDRATDAPWQAQVGVILSSHILSCHIMSYPIMSCQVISYHVISWHAMSCHDISCHVMSIRHVLLVVTYLHTPYSICTLAGTGRRDRVLLSLVLPLSL